MAIYGYNGKILYVDLSARESRTVEHSENWYRLFAGGGLMGTKLLLDDTKPGLDAFDPEAELIFTSSVIAGQKGPGLARYSIVCKSPLSGGVGEARGEGAFAPALKASGYDAVVFTGASEKPVAVCVGKDDVVFEDASDLWGKNTLETALACAEKFGADPFHVAAIGIAGENRVRYASVVTGGANNAVRLGAGAVMGSKNLKAFVLKPVQTPECADPEALAKIAAQYEADIPGNQLCMWQRETPGFSAAADLSDYDTAYICERNFTTDLSVSSSNYQRYKYMDSYRGENHCPGCPGDCMKFIGPADAALASTSIHQEVTGAFGPNLCNPDLGVVLQANVLCNEYGIDPASLGVVIGFAMELTEKGLLDTTCIGGGEPLRFGATTHILTAVEKIAKREKEGDLLAEGVKIAGEKIGGDAPKYAMHVKGVEMVAFEPRTQTNLALGFAVAPIGPRYDICEHDWDFDVVTGWDHTLNLSRALGILNRVPMEQLSLEKVRNFKALYTIWSACDALDLCIFASAPTRALSIEQMSELISAVTGWKTSSYEMMRIGTRRDVAMRMYNLREGLTCEDDILPDRFFETEVTFGRLKGAKLDKELFREMVKAWYSMNGWNEKGEPSQAVIADFVLGEKID